VLPVRGNSPGGGTVVGETPADDVVAPMVVEVVSGTVVDVVDVDVVDVEVVDVEVVDVEVVEVVGCSTSKQNDTWLNPKGLSVFGLMGACRPVSLVLSPGL
jgi:hypothetical protein